MSTSTVAEILHDKAHQTGRKALFTVGPDVLMSEAVALMANNAISSMIITDGDEMLGLITLKEMLQGLNAQGGALMQARCGDVMKVNPPVAHPEDSVDHLRGLMTELHITHVPVMDHGKLVGILSYHDIARSAIKDVDFENRLLKQYIKHWPE